MKATLEDSWFPMLGEGLVFNMTKKQFWDNMAEEYDLLRIVYPYLDRFQDSVLLALQENSRGWGGRKMRGLEIGCGTGDTTWKILLGVPGVELTAVDKSPDMIELAKKKIKSPQLKANVRFEEGDALDVTHSFEEGEFDFVVSSWTVHNFDPQYRRDVFGEVECILKEGGLFVLADKIAYDNPKLHRKSYEFMKNRYDLLRKLGKPEVAQHWLKHNEFDNQPERRLTESRVRSELRNVGFRDIRKVFRQQVDATYTARKA